MKTIYYPGVMYPGEGGFWVVFPDIPGCTSYGRTVQDAAAQAEIALAGHVGLMVRDNDPLPAPTPLDRLGEVMIDTDDTDVGRFLVQVEIPARRLSIDVPMAESLVTQIDGTGSVAWEVQKSFPKS